MDELTEKKALEDLREELHQHNYRYYVLDEPVISDSEFDQKMKALMALEERFPQWSDPNSPSVRVGGGLSPGFTTMAHGYRMYSLDNSYDLYCPLVHRYNQIQTLYINVALFSFLEEFLNNISQNQKI